jgi:flavin reductase (DIM6/NTAB) family NADH-FMN oxidoreductase RutF
MNRSGIADVFGHVHRDLWVVTAQAGQRRGGLIATFVTPASIVPEEPRVFIALARHHYTWSLVEESRAFALHLLGERHLDWVWRFGLESGRDLDKLDGLNLRHGPSGSPLLADALGWLDCQVETRLVMGDRTAYLAEVLDGALIAREPILTARSMWELAPAERRQQLSEQLKRDIALDAEAISAWRSHSPQDRSD